MPNASPIPDRRGTPLSKRSALLILALLVVAIVYLRWQGRVWACQQGDVFNPIAFHVDVHNSQHFLDVYSLSHMLHGVLFFGFFYLFRKRIPLDLRLVYATAIEIAWEMLENSPIIINRYRDATVSLGYTGDSITNSIGDVLSFAFGFYITRKLGLKVAIVVFVLTELLMLWLIRDNLLLNVMMLLWPIDAIRKWQSGG